MPHKDLEERRVYARAYARKYRANPANAERIYGYTKKYRKKNPHTHRATNARYRERHPERIAATQKESDRKRNQQPVRKAERRAWVKNNPEKARAAIKNAVAKRIDHYRALWVVHANHRRKVKQDAAGSYTLEQWIARVEFYGYCCAYCGKELTMRSITTDHVKPLSKGGSNWPANLVPACRSCNSKKQAKSGILPTWISHRQVIPCTLAQSIV